MTERLPEYHRKSETPFIDEPSNIFNKRDGDQEDQDFSFNLPHKSTPGLSIIQDSDEIRIKKKKRCCICTIFLGLVLLILVIVIIIFATKKDGSHSNPKPIDPDTPSHLFTDVILPQYDLDKKAAYLTLQNKMKVFLISDPTSQMSGAAISVSVGSSSQDRSLPGQAHFLEHLLFFGSQSYPQKDALFDFIKSNGGLGNAYTAAQQTNYHFQVNSKSFQKSFDILSDMVHAPLLPDEGFNTEYKAVNSEYEKDLVIEGWRLQQLMCHVSNPQSAYNRFSIGNTKTLYEQPLEKGINPGMIVRSFFKKYYSSNLMSAAIYDSRPLEEMKMSAMNHLSKMVNKETKKPQEKNPKVKAFDSSNLGQRIVYQSLDQVEKIYILFVLPPTLDQYKESPQVYLQTLLNLSGNGSLKNTLMKKGWIKDFHAEIFQELTDMTMLLLQSKITQKGYQNYQELLDYHYKYVHLITQKWTDREYQQKVFRKMNLIFNYKKTGQSPLSEVRRVASKLQKVEPKYAISDSKLILGFNNSTLQNIAKTLTPESSIIFEKSPKPLIGFTSIEPWFNVTYIASEISPINLNKWNNFTKTYNDLYINMGSDFEPEDVIVLCSDAKMEQFCSSSTYNQESNELQPLLAYFDEQMEIWYKFDKSLNIAMTAVSFNIEGDFSPDDLHRVVLLEILCVAIQNKINENYASALQYGYEINVSNSYNGIKIQLNGFSDKIAKLIQSISRFIHKIQITEEEFGLAYQTVEDIHNSYKTEMPYYLLIQDLQNLINKFAYSKEDRIQKLHSYWSSITQYKVNRFSSEFFDKIYVKMLIYGNMQMNKAITLGRVAVQQLGVSSKVSRDFQQTVKLEGSYIWKDALDNPKQLNDATMIYFQLGERSLFNENQLRAYEMLASSFMFNQLRTKQQLGYVVKAARTNINNILGFVVLVQGSAKKPIEVGDLIIEALQQLQKKIEEMTEKELDEIKQALVDKYQEKPKSLNQGIAKMWPFISNGSYSFISAIDGVWSLGDINLSSFKSFAKMISNVKYLRIEVRCLDFLYLSQLYHGVTEAELAVETSREDIPSITSDFKHFEKIASYFEVQNNIDQYK